MYPKASDADKSQRNNRSDMHSTSGETRGSKRRRLSVSVVGIVDM